jgi:hypothetical protein
MDHINHAIQQRLYNLRCWPVIDEKGQFFGSRVFTKNKSMVIARCTLLPDGGISREIDIHDLNVWDLTAARDPSKLLGETELICTEEYFCTFIDVMESSGFVRRSAPIY